MGGELNPNAQVYVTADGVILTESTTVMARVKDGDTWSALNTADFLVDLVPATSETFIICRDHV